METTEKTTLIEAAASLKSGQFVHIRGYKNEHGEIANVTVHADSSYESVHKRSLAALEVIAAEPAFTLPICWNFWQDPVTGEKFNREKKGRVRVVGHKETVVASDPDFQEAIAKLRQSISNPREVTQNFEQVGKSTYDNANTGKTYFRNVLIHSKEIVQEGVYPIKCTLRVNAIRDAIESLLPIGQYRCYTLEEGNYESVSIMGEKLSSSSSSESP